MSNVIEVMGLLAGSYLLGAVPFAYLIGRRYGVNLGLVGTGNLGAGNLSRAVGWGPGATAASLDVLKGFAPVAAAVRLGAPHAAVTLAGVAAVAGHNWSAYLGGRGGRGLATSVGVVLGLSPLLLMWTGGWAFAGWWLGGGLAGFIGWGLLPVVAMVFASDAVVLAVLLALLMAARRCQGGLLVDGRSRLERLIYDTDRVPARKSRAGGARA